MPPIVFNLIANLLLLVAYLVRDILLLRLLCMAAGLFMIPFWLLQEDPQWVPLAWTIVFMTIHASWVLRLWRERRPVKFSPEERELYDESFPTLKPHEMKKLLANSRWGSVEAGASLLECGAALEGISIIRRGTADIETGDGKRIHQGAKGDLVGAVAFATDQPTRVAWVATEPIRKVSWQSSDLAALFEQSTAVQVAFDALLARGLSRHLAAVALRN